ncbi:MAG: hypothetical protein CMG64_04035 [Candidatus Marinimicrobia bacterium]|nr:hypothetical protein [Candidatus Neomarinimicrobiota bacterium]|tara:strand:+ start:6886 stop:8133 length:1248 start_codon:yes stop_codon:yes gene_type:complete
MNNKIYSEVNPLRLVITHKPGIEHSYITPDNIKEKIEINGKLKDNPNFLLFDDIIQLNKAQKEHKELYEILHHFTDGNAYEFTDLLNYIIKDNSIKSSLINECIHIELKSYNNSIDFKNLINLDTASLVETLISGYLDGKKIFTHPVPNLIFTRDIAVAIGKTLLLTWNKKNIRNRENILSKYVFSNFKAFKDMNIYDFHKKHPDLSIEGGDILILDEQRVCIGISERTALESIKKISNLIFKEGFKSIFAINLPKERAYMHLDTVFTLTNKNEALIYPPFLDNNTTSEIHVLKNNNDHSISHENLINTLKNDGLELKPIYCGGNSKIMQNREQWTDGANAFALEPGKIICYKCNEHTINELSANNYKIITVESYLNDYKFYNESKNKFAITLDSSELVRGRGGPRCLTLPILRI